MFKTNKNNSKRDYVQFFIKSGLYLLTFLVLSVALFFFGIFWQDKSDLLAVTNAFYFSTFLFFGFGFMVFAANKNVFSPLVYGTKSFFLMFVGKRPKNSYYEYTKDIAESPMPKLLILFPLISAIPNLVIAIILHIIYNSTI